MLMTQKKYLNNDLHLLLFAVFITLSFYKIKRFCYHKGFSEQSTGEDVMADQPLPVQEVLTEAVADASRTDSQNLSLEALVLLINTERLRSLEKKITAEFLELKKRQDEVSFLHKLIKTINTATANEEFDCTQNEELKSLLAKAKEYGVDIKEDKFKYNKEERERLIENIRITADDNNVLNDMQLQTITRLTTERYESYQLARSIMRPLHEDKVNKARAIAGR